jgi:hypothetical protein
MPNLTPTEQRIANVLADGMPHRRRELLACLQDPEAELNALRVHLCNLRAKLRPIGQDILCELSDRGLFYRQVRLLARS